ncbi:carboxylating nicotinate-nucleotide diphosphorylase [Desulfonema magnum]|uniref:Probable nicotinate-nucleotide pyrophosphorylase [carboxylating] n=1 Tax=Desulfonema magnum TaxID=45655 RepID=A0A975BP57_9BACT|nr:carboxylating nicotinate-nucleotide diphosphorylase [Desulfonema magnum]QTA88788.1 putative nicotinate-nucleotide pyrophosphorylase [Desulfonema magnum]
MNDIFTDAKTILLRVLEEDIGDGDITTLCTVPREAILKGTFIAKSPGVTAGLEIAGLTFSLLNEQVQFTPHIADGDKVKTGQVIATVSGPGRAILSGERVALNLLQRMSGIATLTREFSDAVEGTSAIILDTRKTVPGLRVFDKWAVRLGRGQNHRFGLYDMVLIKDNHIAAVGSISEAVACVRAKDNQKRAIEVEVRNLTELQEALELNPDRILLDNMTPDEMREAVRTANGRVPLEASGNVSLENVAAIAATGVDYISVGMLTHSVKAMDISLLIEN